MLGPLLVTAMLRMSGLALTEYSHMRSGGQWVVAIVLGLQFSAAALAQLARLVPLLASLCLLTLGVGVLAALILQRAGRLDFATAFFSGVPGGVNEMATLAAHSGADARVVAVSQSIRLMMVVFTVPFLAKALGVVASTDGLHGAPSLSFDLRGLLLLLALTGSAAWTLRRLGLPNAYVFGPLLVTMALTCNGIGLSDLPHSMAALAQIALGYSLGTRYDRSFLSQAPTIVKAQMIALLAAMSVALVFAWLATHVAGLDFLTLLLASAPGGVAEMSLTAHQLGLSVVIVTISHIVRTVVVLVLARPLYLVLRRRLG